MISTKKYLVGLILALGLAMAGNAAAKMGQFGFGKPKKETKEDLLEKRKKRRPAKMQDVMWDKETEGMVRIFVKPAANLFIDGKLQSDPKGKRSKSERFTASLTAGTHVLKLEIEGFEPEEKKITVEAGKPYVENFVLMKMGLKRDEMVLINAGKFWMGLDEFDLKYIVQKIGGEKKYHMDELPRHQEETGAYYMDKYEVTNRQYKKFVDAAGHTPPDSWEGGTYPSGKALHPAVDVTWNDAGAYCKWGGKRLPAEKEWEKAARWGPGRNTSNKKDDSTLYPWGLTFHRNKVNTDNGGPGEATPTGKYEKGKSAYGLYDMSGNVKEWTADWYAVYPGNEAVAARFATLERFKVARGGSFLEGEFECLATCRSKYSPTNSDEDIGFRCVKDAK